MWEIGIGSLFRDSQQWCGIHINQVDRYFQQIEQQTCSQPLICILEGHSVDDTRMVLQAYANRMNNVLLLSCEQQCSTTVQSTTNQQRISYLSTIANRVLNELKDRCQYIAWIESDLIIEPNVIEDLLTTLKETEAAIVAPLVFLQEKNSTERFYDTWGFVDSEDKPWASASLIPQQRIVRMSSVGSCAVMDANFLCNNNISFGTGAFRELCSSVRKHKGLICVDTNVKVFHPGENGCKKRRWI